MRDAEPAPGTETREGDRCGMSAADHDMWGCDCFNRGIAAAPEARADDFQPADSAIDYQPPAPGEPGEGARPAEGFAAAVSRADSERESRSSTTSWWSRADETDAATGEPLNADAIAARYRYLVPYLRRTLAEERQWRDRTTADLAAALAEAAGLRAENVQLRIRGDRFLAEAAGLRERLAAVEAVCAEWDEAAGGPFAATDEIRAALTASPCEVAP